MPLSALVPPATDPTPIFEHFRGNFEYAVPAEIPVPILLLLPLFAH